MTRGKKVRCLLAPANYINPEIKVGETVIKSTTTALIPVKSSALDEIYSRTENFPTNKRQPRGPKAETLEGAANTLTAFTDGEGYDKLSAELRGHVDTLVQSIDENVYRASMKVVEPVEMVKALVRYLEDMERPEEITSNFMDVLIHLETAIAVIAEKRAVKAAASK